METEPGSPRPRQYSDTVVVRVVLVDVPAERLIGPEPVLTRPVSLTPSGCLCTAPGLARHHKELASMLPVAELPGVGA
jgi:hypothetical protein